jgi:hypothetical protein
MERLLILIIICASYTSFGQLSKKALKFEGHWVYKNHTAISICERHGDELHFVDYRINKIGDSTKVEEAVLRKEGDVYLYELSTLKYSSDNIITTKTSFKGGKSLKFYNTELNVPYSIQFKTGFLNKNNKRIIIKYGPNDKGVKLYLSRF